MSALYDVQIIEHTDKNTGNLILTGTNPLTGLVLCCAISGDGVAHDHLVSKCRRLLERALERGEGSRPLYIGFDEAEIANA